LYFGLPPPLSLPSLVPLVLLPRRCHRRLGRNSGPRNPRPPFDGILQPPPLLLITSNARGARGENNKEKVKQQNSSEGLCSLWTRQQEFTLLYSVHFLDVNTTETVMYVPGWSGTSFGCDNNNIVQILPDCGSQWCKTSVLIYCLRFLTFLISLFFYLFLYFCHRRFSTISSGFKCLGGRKLYWVGMIKLSWNVS
jgi:hypothetical protein